MENKLELEFELSNTNMNYMQSSTVTADLKSTGGLELHSHEKEEKKKNRRMLNKNPGKKRWGLSMLILVLKYG